MLALRRRQEDSSVWHPLPFRDTDDVSDQKPKKTAILEAHRRTKKRGRLEAGSSFWVAMRFCEPNVVAEVSAGRKVAASAEQSPKFATTLGE